MIFEVSNVFMLFLYVQCSSPIQDTDIVISDFNDLHEHSVYSVSVSACLRSDSSACSPPTSQNVTTQARGEVLTLAEPHEAMLVP